MMQAQYLRPLRKRLATLRRRRQRFRWATAASALAVAVLWALAGVFALDWLFQRNIDVWQRGVLLVLTAGGIAWAARRFVLPWLSKREDDSDMALIVQSDAHIDSDLVAALEFESPEASHWGSAQLENEVIGRIAARQGNIDVMSSMPSEPLATRAKVLLATAAVWAALAVLAPDYVATFFRRLAFGSQHYPAQTQLVSIKVNGKEVDLSAPGRVAGETAVHVPYGHSVRFEVTAAGARPDAGRVELVTQTRTAAEIVPLEPATSAEEKESQAVYQGDYAHLNQSGHYKVYLGDAWTDDFALSVVPLPVVEVEPEVVPPIYARQNPAAIQKLPRGMRQFQVLLGSEVHLRLHSDRPLKSAQVKIRGQKSEVRGQTSDLRPPTSDLRSQEGDARTFAMQRDEGASKDEELWTLPAAGTPLAAVKAELGYSIQVTDAEGQVPDQPLDGAVTIEADLPPRIDITTKSKLVLPTASPKIHYEASDDHALGQVWLTWEATSGDASKPAEKREGRIDVCRFAPEAGVRTQAGEYTLPLQSLFDKKSGLHLVPGDTLKVTFHAADYRGPAEATTTDSDPPAVFQVTDLHGFEASMYEADQKSAEALENIRKKHTGEESP